MGPVTIKVCGLTRLVDARVAHEAGADWLGFVVHAPSPRHVDPARAADIVAALDGVHAVAVMVAPSPDEALAVARRIGAARVQVHGVDPASWPRDFPLPTSFTVRVSADGSLIETLPAAEHLVLLDTADGVVFGGTGRAFPWETARVVAATRAIMLAGGLGPDNVDEALERVQPFGVDASSKLEASPGIKDEHLVRRFVAAVRSWDERRRERN